VPLHPTCHVSGAGGAGGKSLSCCGFGLGGTMEGAATYSYLLMNLKQNCGEADRDGESSYVPSSALGRAT
jgi:hypothetical protein